MELTSKNKPWDYELDKLKKVIMSDCPILLTGETGCGKDYLAKIVHRLSVRNEFNFVAVNCAAVSEGLLESELFGHKKGSFTGAVDNRNGAFRTANKGTIFLDEIGDMPLGMQAKLLRVIENQEVKAVGSDENTAINVRLVSATHQDLKKKMEKGLFRMDLYYRINVVNVKVPTLRERPEDFDGLLYSFAREQHVSFSYEAIKLLKEHSWPGNIRELRNVVTKGSALFRRQEIEACDVAELLDVDSFKVEQKDENKMLTPLKEIEREMIVDALRKNRGNQRQAAHSLRIPKSTLNDKIKTYGLFKFVSERSRRRDINLSESVVEND